MRLETRATATEPGRDAFLLLAFGFPLLAETSRGLQELHVLQIPELDAVVDEADGAETALGLEARAAEPLDAERVGAEHDVVMDVHFVFLLVEDVHLQLTTVLLARDSEEDFVLRLDFVEVVLRLRVRIARHVRVPLFCQLTVALEDREELHAVLVVLVLVIVFEVELLQARGYCARRLLGPLQGGRTGGRSCTGERLHLVVVLDHGLGSSHGEPALRHPAHGRDGRLLHGAWPTAGVPSRSRGLVARLPTERLASGRALWRRRGLSQNGYGSP
mmetsp:Transcript_137178/g.438673  ORF Transcript_137178/g.438673 Transcript_137178/m.438673 type:complete len:274 (+) Transcript_137178:801-1622(+)